MADKSTDAMRSGLSRAMADPAATLLLGTKNQPGLFASTVAGKEAAERCKRQGYVTVTRTEERGKTILEHCAITEKGAQYLMAESDPRQVMEDFVRAVEQREDQFAELLEQAQQARREMALLRARAEQLFRELSPSSLPTEGMLLATLQQWHTQNPSGDCPLPELYRRAGERIPGLTLGRFHDELRRLYAQQHLHLHPWTGPLHEMPEPAHALLVGHEIAYYASPRT